MDTETKEKLIEHEKPYKYTWSQVKLNYQINEDIIVIPKSHNKEHHFDNIEVFDFELTKEDIYKIKNM